MHRTLHVFAGMSEFDVAIDDIGRFPGLGALLSAALKRPKAWLTRRVDEKRLYLADYAEDAVIEGLADALLAAFDS